MRIWAALLPIALTACAAATQTAPSTDPIAYRLDENGIQLAASPQRVDFGRTDHSTIPAMSKLAGQAPGSRGDCGDGGDWIAWPDGTVLVFAQGEFRGWASGADRAGLDCARV